MRRWAPAFGFLAGLTLLVFTGAAHADGVCGGGGPVKIDAGPGDGAVGLRSTKQSRKRSLRAYGGGLVFAAALGGVWIAARRNRDGTGDG